MAQAEVLLSICSHRSVAAPTVHSLEQLRLASYNLAYQPTYILQLLVGDALISRARSQACSKFLSDTDCPYMIFIDDDMLFTPEHVTRIYNHLRRGYDIIGGIYAVRGASQLSSYGWDGSLQIDMQVHEVEFLATGFMGISRKLLERMLKELNLPLLNPDDWSKCYPFFEAKRTMSEERAHGGQNIYISEDWDFCQKARKIGVKSYADTAIQLGHLREEVFFPQHVRQIQGQQQMQKQLFGSIDKQKELIGKVSSDLAEFLTKSQIEVENKMLIAPRVLAKKWAEKPESFYLDNEFYLFDLAMFNSQEGYFTTRINEMVNVHNQKILDVGCGIGTLTFILQGQGNEVTGWDINKRCVDFADWKKTKYSLGGTFTQEKPDFSQFDFVTAIDTLEHIANLREFLLDLGKGMKQGAKFYHSDYFPKAGVWPMHYEENAQFVPQWLREAGLIPWDEKWAVRI